MRHVHARLVRVQGQGEKGGQHKRRKERLREGGAEGKGEKTQESAGGGLWSSRPPAKILEQGLFCAFVFMLSRPVLYY